MSGRDDMILRPTIQETYGNDAAGRSRVDRRVDEHSRGRGLFSRLARRRAAQHLARNRVTRSAVRNTGLRKSIGGALASTATRSMAAAGRFGRFMLNPTTAAGMLGSFAALYAAKEITGKPMSQLMQIMNNYVLGNVDDEARARVGIGQRLSADQNLVQHIGRRGQIDDEIRQAANLMYESERSIEIGQSIIGTDFPALDSFDVLIRIFEREFSEGFASNNGKQHLATLLLAHHIIRNKGIASFQS